MYNEKQVAKLLAGAKEVGEPILAALTLALYYGLRRSEVLGLRWTDIDFENKTMTISNTVVQNGELRIEVEETKTKKSHRSIGLIASTIPYLQALKEKQKEAGLILDKVCVWPDGNLVRPDYITRKANKITKKCSLPVSVFHLFDRCGTLVSHSGGGTMYKITIEQIGRDRDEEIVIRCHELGDEVTAIINKLKKSETILLGTKDGETFRIAVKDVCYIESVDNKTFICTEKNVFESRQKLYELEELTYGTKLFRCSKSMILNIGKIRSVAASVNGRFEARLLNSETVVISRQYVPALKEKLGM